MRRFRQAGRSAKWLAAALFLFAGTLTTGCASERAVAQPRHRVVVVHKRPPAPRREVRPRRPARRYVWVGGHWRWRRGSYAWVRGRWVVPPHRRARWAAAHWRRHRHGGWVFVAGRWR